MRTPGSSNVAPDAEASGRERYGRRASAIIPARLASRARLAAEIALGALSVATLSAAAGCAPAAVESHSLSLEQRQLAPVGRQSPSDRLVRQDFASMTELSLEEAVRRLRPEWVRASPSARQSAEPASASVYARDSYVGGLEALRLIPIGAVEEMRYLTPTAARSWFGMFCRCAGGVIIVTTRVED